MIVLNFYEKFLLCVKWGRWESFGPKINILKLFSEYANNKLFLTKRIKLEGKVELCSKWCK